MSDIDKVRLYLTYEENQIVSDQYILAAMDLLKSLPFIPIGVAKVIRNSLRKGNNNGKEQEQ